MCLMAGRHAPRSTMIQSSVNAHWLNTFRLNVLCYWVLHVATQTSSCRIPSSPYGSMMRPPLLRLPTRSIRYDWSCFWNEENLLALANTTTHLPDIVGQLTGSKGNH
ncbi:unnamed protein product [Brassica oleracea var. botrytis]